MRTGAILGAAGALALSCLSAAAARSCSFERQETGFDSYLPLGEAKLGLSCTSWIGSSVICDAGNLSAVPRTLEIGGSLRYGNGFVGVPLPFSEGHVEAALDARSRSLKIGIERP